jgi:hypothetical protein
MAGARDIYGRQESCIKGFFLFERPERKGPRRKLEDNIKMDLDKVGWEGMNWIVLAEYRDR